jgi:hypothetical protein
MSHTFLHEENKRGGEMKNIRKSDYELNRASFSATVGLGLMTVSYAIKDNPGAALGAILLVLIGLLFWVGASMSYLRHFDYRGTEHGLNLQALKDLFGI